MTVPKHRLLRIKRIRSTQLRATQARLAQVEIGLAMIDRTRARIGGFRNDLALQTALTDGMHIRASGEFGLRLDAIEDALCVKRKAACADRHNAQTLTISAWQQSRVAETLFDRAVQTDAIVHERAASAQPLPCSLRHRRGGS